jgi:hypothetical protein
MPLAFVAREVYRSRSEPQGPNPCSFWLYNLFVTTKTGRI